MPRYPVDMGSQTRVLDAVQKVEQLLFGTFGNHLDVTAPQIPDKPRHAEGFSYAANRVAKADALDPSRKHNLHTFNGNTGTHAVLIANADGGAKFQ